MSIYTTMYVSRRNAIEQIKKIALEEVEKNLMNDRFLKKMKLEDLIKCNFSKEELEDLLKNIENYSNELLGEILDNEIFSFYSCENYIVNENGDEPKDYY